MKERRRKKRYVVTFPVVIESKDRFSFVTMTRNAASSGLLVMTTAKMQVGEPVNITYRLRGGDPPLRDVTGRIVRVEPNTGDEQADWPYLAAVAFSGPEPAIRQLFGDDAAPSDDEETF
jgi:hypothetical protein